MACLQVDGALKIDANQDAASRLKLGLRAAGANNFYIAALLWQRLAIQWFFIGLQWDFDDSGPRRVIGANPSRFLDDHFFGHLQRARASLGTASDQAPF